MFNKIDLTRAYDQIPVEECDIPKTAVITPFGLFEILRMAVGLRNAAQTFQRFIHDVIRGIDFVCLYLDDILEASVVKAGHVEHLQLLFRLLCDHGVTVNPAKELNKPSVDFLGRRIDASGIKVLPEKVDAIKDFPETLPCKQLRRLLGVVNYYRRLIPKCAKIMQPVTDLFRGSQRTLAFTNAARSSFAKLKKAVANTAPFMHPQTDAPNSLVTEDSNEAEGAILQKFVDGSWQPLGFFSKRLQPAETCYSTFGRKLSAVYLAIRYFRSSFEGRDIVIFTGRKSLVYAIA